MYVAVGGQGGPGTGPPLVTYYKIGILFVSLSVSLFVFEIFCLHKQYLSNMLAFARQLAIFCIFSDFYISVYSSFLVT